MAVDGWVCFKLLVGRKHGDFEPYPAWYVCQVVTGTVSITRYVNIQRLFCTLGLSKWRELPPGPRSEGA